ncbi:Uu.00g034450.m01.CDS01 [Anthostomella pinea]|uniref:Uu.00g034450.m01.CDS01 n=1 Tax=Anthostomella pinea TaxID=933095 RepID=A0AAI8V9N9_9PEZI|nr:Uu.00g034450.m01.CDS01 [Anthostomella pinea]
MGISFGGPLAWVTASRLPKIVKSLALIITSPVGARPNPADKLPPAHPEGGLVLREAFKLPDDKEDDDAWIKSAAAHGAGKGRIEAESDTTYRREKKSGTMWTRGNHGDAACVRWPRETLKRVECPTVVIHAAKDQVFPLEYAKALRDDVGDATLVVVENCGHELPHRARGTIVDAILANVKKGEQASDVAKRDELVLPSRL